MSKIIGRAKLLWRGKEIFLPEYLRVLSTRGISGVRQYLRMISMVTENERLVEHERKAVVQLFIPPIPSRAFARYLRTYVDRIVLRKSGPHPGVVLIATTSKCPYDCWYCSAYNTPQGEQSTENIEKIIHVLRSWGTSIIGFTGGEPLLRTDTDNIIRQYGHEFSFIIFSSGYGLDAERARVLKANGLFSIAISLDDYRKRHHDRARGCRGAYRTALDAIANAKDAGLYTTIQSVITRDLLENGRMWNFLDFVQQTGADELLLLEPLGTGKLLGKHDDLFLDTREHDKLRWFHDATLDHYTLPKITSFAEFEDKTRFGCGAGVQHAYVDIKGNLWPCNFLPISLGNIINETELVRSRLERYFGRACNQCILMSKRKQLQKLGGKQLPIPFPQAKRLLDYHLRACGQSNQPAFYSFMQPKNGIGNKH